MRGLVGTAADKLGFYINFRLTREADMVCKGVIILCQHCRWQAYGRPLAIIDAFSVMKDHRSECPLE